MDRSRKPSTDWSTDDARSVADFLVLDLGQAPPGGRSAWLADRVRAAINDGVLPVGSTLPPTRELARELGVSRGLVTEAYRRLAEGGQVASRGRTGTVVVHAPAAPERPVTAAPPAGPVSFADPQLRTFDDLRAASAAVDLTPGVPDLAAFPRAAWLRAERRVLAETDPRSLGYADPAGVPAFRASTARWLGRFRGLAVRADDVVVVAGVAQALALLARVLPAHDVKEVAVEDPGSFGARRHLEAWGTRTIGVPVDDDGLDVPALRASGAGAVLVTPAHQFPTGVVLAPGRRRDLARWAEEGGVVLEDDYDAEHRYDRAPVAAFHPGAPHRTCYAGSLSKTLAPALRVGWLVAPPWLRDDVVAAKRDTDLGNATLPQLVLAHLMDGGDLERHLRATRVRQRRRRDAMVGAVAEHLPRARVHGAAAGLHLTLTFPDGEPGSDVRLADAALEAGVKVQPLSWHRERPGAPGLVLGYAASSPGEIQAGVARLGAVLGSSLGPQRSLPRL